MKVLITGIDGYSGWPLALHLLRRGHDVAGIDNFVTRKRV
ncbi:MAG: NAD-dependent dehydratase, partial [Thermoplasmata archaeon]|nr:NAD-dependent dehydratase [Thermoplasmata archaeon]